MPKMEVSPALILATMHLPQVRDALSARAGRVAATAEAITAAEGVEGSVIRESGTRPKGRPYERVLHTNADQEFGTSKTSRRRIMGRAAAES